MHALAKFFLGALAVCSAAAVTSAGAAVDASDGANGRPHYDDRQPCHYYLNRGLPGPRRCTRFFSNALGSAAYVQYGFVFRNRRDFLRYRDRGWFTDRNRLAAKEDRTPPHEGTRRSHQEKTDRNRFAAKEDGRPPHEETRGSHQEKGEHRTDRQHQDVAGRAPRAAMAYEKNASGGATREQGVSDSRSGGASGD